MNKPPEKPQWLVISALVVTVLLIIPYIGLGSAGRGNEVRPDQVRDRLPRLENDAEENTRAEIRELSKANQKGNLADTERELSRDTAGQSPTEAPTRAASGKLSEIEDLLNGQTQ